MTLQRRHWGKPPCFTGWFGGTPYGFHSQMGGLSDNQTITNATVKWYRNEPVFLYSFVTFGMKISFMMMKKSWLFKSHICRWAMATRPSNARSWPLNPLNPGWVNTSGRIWETIFLDWDWVLFIITSLFSSEHELLRGWSYDMVLLIWVLNLWSIARWGFKCRFKHFFSVKAGSE